MLQTSAQIQYVVLLQVNNIIRQQDDYEVYAKKRMKFGEHPTPAIILNREMEINLRNNKWQRLYSA